MTRHHMTGPARRPIAVAVTALLVLASCGSDTAADIVEPAVDDPATGMLDLAAFFDGALATEPVTTDCTLADGTDTQCYELTVAGFPANRDAIGPWCPATTSDGAAGIWFDGDAVYDIDGEFISDLADIYDDPTWKLYDEDGNVLSTDTSEKFNDLVTGGPQADPDAGPVNLCVYGEIEWADGGGPIAATVEIPVTPIRADTPSSAPSTIGVTLDGVLIENSAPVDLILGNYTIGAFDPCGGHVNPQEGYHMHATTGCSNSTDDIPAGETALFGYALDGYAIHTPYDDAEADAGLDDCNGHETPELGYHYHANQVEENAVLTCFTGLVVEVASAGPGGGGSPPGGSGAPPADSDPSG